MARIFISYSTKDPEPARQIKAWIESIGFETPFIDFEIEPGADWERKLYAELERSLAVLLVVTSGWLESKWCFAEYVQARALGKPIFPIVETPVEGSYLAPEIQRLDLQRDKEGGLDRLRSALEALRSESQAGFSFPKNRSPYPGLRAFDRGDAAVYFGREEEIRRLTELLRARRSQGGSRLIVVLGASGSGKSSLMRAGVLPRLERETKDWALVGPIRPRSHPLQELTEVLSAALPPRDGPESGQSAQRVRALLEENADEGITALATDLRWRSGKPDAHVLLAIDQGEELFSPEAAGERSAFLRTLAAIARSHAPVVGLMTFRSDFLGLLQSAPELNGDFHDFKLNPLPAERISVVIRGPAQVVGLKIDDDLVLRAARDASEESALPLLAFALRKLYERHREAGKLSLADYMALGDARSGLGPLENAVRETADQTIQAKRLSPEQLQALRRSFIPSLVRLDAEGKYVRRPATWEDLPEAGRPLLERLVEARLLTTGERRGKRVVEVSHEAVLRHWPLLRSWLDEERDLLIGLEQLERDLADWRSQTPERKKDALLTGLKLSRARGWLQQSGPAFSDELRQFINASAAAADRRRQAVIWGSVSLGIVLAIAAGFSTVQWLVAQRERDQAAASLLVVRSQEAVADRRVFDAADMAKRALATTRSAETRSALLQSLLLLHPGLLRRSVLTADVPLRLARKGSEAQVLIAGAAGGVFAIDPSNLELSRLWAGDDSVAILALDGASRLGTGLVYQSGDLQILSAAGGPSHQLRLCDNGQWLEAADLHLAKGLVAIAAENETHAEVFRCDLATAAVGLDDCEHLEGPEGRFREIAIDPVGRQIAFGSEDGKVTVRRLSNAGEPITVNNEGRVDGLAWDAAGRWLAIGFLREGEGGVSRDIFAVDSETKALVGPITLPSGGDPLAWSAEARSLAAPCDGRGAVICVWSRGSKDFALRSRLAGHRQRIKGLAWTSDGLLSVGLDHELLLWDPDQTAGAWSTLEAPERRTGFTDIAAAGDGRRLAIGTNAGAVVLYEAQTRKVEAILQSGHTDEITAVTWDPGSHRVAATDDSGRLYIWSPPQALPLWERAPSNQGIEAVSWPGDGERLFVPLQDGKIAAIEARTGKVEYSTNNHSGAAIGLEVSPDGNDLISVDTHGEFIRWSPATLVELDRFTPPPELGAANVSRDEIAFARNGAGFAAVGNDGLVLIYKRASANPWRILGADAIQLQDVAISDGDDLIAALANNNVVHVWRLDSGEKLAMVNLSTLWTLDPEGWNAGDGRTWRAEKLSWLAEGHTLAVSLAAGKALLIDMEDELWASRIEGVLGNADPTDSESTPNLTQRARRRFE